MPNFLDQWTQYVFTMNPIVDGNTSVTKQAMIKHIVTGKKNKIKALPKRYQLWDVTKYLKIDSLILKQGKGYLLDQYKTLRE